MASRNDSSKKDEFRKYLEKSGVIDTITKVLVALYEEPERPGNAVSYIKKYMGAPSNQDSESMKREIEELKAQVEDLKTQLKQQTE